MVPVEKDGVVKCATQLEEELNSLWKELEDRRARDEEAQVREGALVERFHALVGRLSGEWSCLFVM